MTLTVKFIGALRHISEKAVFSLPFQEDMSIKDLITQLSAEIPKLKRTICDHEFNDSRSNSLILINGKEISILSGYETRLCDRDEIVFVPVVHGG